MDFYTLVKFLHVLAAIGWVGGGLSLLVAGVLARRAKDNTALFGTLGVMNQLGKTWFIPISAATVVLGAITATIGGQWGDFWVLLGLAGFASTFFTGMLLIEPEGVRIGAQLARGETEAAVAAGQRLLTVVKFDYTVMLIVVADMVLKPAWTDFITLAIFAVIVVVSAVMFLIPAITNRTAVAA